VAAVVEKPAFVPAVVVPEIKAALKVAVSSSGRVEIVLANGRRLIVDAMTRLVTNNAAKRAFRLARIGM